MVSDPQIKNISSSGFIASIPDGRMFENFVKKELIGGLSGNIVYDGKYYPTDSQIDILEGNVYEVRANGNLLGITEVESVNSNDLIFRHKESVNFELSDDFLVQLSDAPGLASSLQGYADFKGYDELKFTRIEERRAENEQQETNNSTSTEKSISDSQKLILAATAIGIVVILRR